MDHDIGGAALGNRHDAKVGSSGAIVLPASNLVHTVLRRIDLAREPIAVAIAFNLYTERRDLVAERSGRLKVNRVPTKLDEGVSIVVRVGTCDIRGPIAPSIIFGAPNARFINVDTGRVDVVTSRAN